MTAFVLALLAALIVGQAVERVLASRSHRQERERLVRAVLARHMPEFAALERAIGSDPGFGNTNGRRPGPRAVPDDPDPHRDDRPTMPIGMDGRA